MTQRGLIIGTSHTAALRLAWRDTPGGWPDMDLTFAALPGDMADFQVNEGCLMARDEDSRTRLLQVSGRDRFDLSAFDFVAVCGGTASGFHAIRLYNAARCAALPSVRGPLGPNLSLISTACFVTALTGLIRSAGALPLLHAIAAQSPARLLAIPHPGLSHDALKAGATYLGFQRMYKQGDAAALSQLLQQASLLAYGGVASVVTPPAQVRQDHFFTHSRFRRGATRLGRDDSQAQPAQDVLHGNAAYGHHILSALARLL